MLQPSQNVSSALNLSASGKRFFVIFLFLLAWPAARLLAAPKVHTVTLGPNRRVPYVPTDATPETKSDESSTLHIRALYVDDRQKEWTTGPIHDVTDRTFTVRRALRLNDALPADPAARWVWEPGPWLMVDRTTGHITALHLPDFDSVVSNIVWFRDYAAYCGIAATARGGLYAIVAQLGARRAVVQKQIGRWPQANHFIPVCQPAKWQRLPMRVTIQPTGGEAATYDVLGSSSLVEEGDNSDEN
ncbi:MAG TPA: hypothetical protein VFE22_15225 [Edaphobacter sp.]|nr:hypothetical protein [Edaphobacter sp.]